MISLRMLAQGEAGAHLRVRLDRLAVAANNAIAAARAGDVGEMRRQLRRFDALTSAIWAVQDAVYGSCVGGTLGR